MRDISDIILDGGTALERLLREAFEAGIERGRNELRDQLRQVLSPSDPKIAPEIAAPPIPGAIMKLQDFIQQRAAPGTVKPTIIRLIDEAKAQGISTEELLTITGFKPNSVRGTLSTLHAEKVIHRYADRWFATEALLVEGHGLMNKGALE